MASLCSENMHFDTYEEALDDLLFRYVNFIEDSEFNDLVRVMFHIEQAWWTYIDCTLPANPHLENKQFHTFTVDIINYSPFLQHFKDQAHSALNIFKEYKRNIPTCGTIIVDASLEYCLVLSMYTSSKNFGFPKGKINQNEPFLDCAIRETYEETGLDCTNYIHKDIYFDVRLNQTSCRLYLVTGVPIEFKFRPKTRHEIRKIQWLLINALPNSREDYDNAAICDGKPGNFFLILPFVKQLKNAIKKLKYPNEDDTSCRGIMKKNVEIKPSKSSAFKPVRRVTPTETVVESNKKVYCKSEGGTPRKCNNTTSNELNTPRKSNNVIANINKKVNDNTKTNEPFFYQTNLLNNLTTEKDSSGADFFRNHGYDNTTISCNKNVKNNDKTKNGTNVNDPKRKKKSSTSDKKNVDSKKIVNEKKSDCMISSKDKKSTEKKDERKTKDTNENEDCKKNKISNTGKKKSNETNDKKENNLIENTKTVKMNGEKLNRTQLIKANKAMKEAIEKSSSTVTQTQCSGTDFIKIFNSIQTSK
uniref:mRNA-decapping enzyme 2 n=1 Tax=Parastrongyloides trichosuri TaxID=131310 RepID=A0A0N4Z849_PARTI